jgi:phosphate transport system substrate-binding protein
VPIDDQNDSIGPGAIEPSSLNVRRGVYRPLSRPLFLYVNVASLDREEVRRFLDFYLRNASVLVERAGGVALSGRVSEMTMARLTKRVPGTLFIPAPPADESLEMILTRSHEGR